MEQNAPRNTAKKWIEKIIADGEATGVEVAPDDGAATPTTLARSEPLAKAFDNKPCAKPFPLGGDHQEHVSLQNCGAKTSLTDALADERGKGGHIDDGSL